jgi:serine protease Do
MLLLILAPLSLLSSRPALADTSSNHFAVELDSPAVVRIVTKLTGTVTCYGCGSGGANVTFPSTPGYVYYTYVSGSGAIISPNGYILTADHVVDATNNADAQNAILQLAIDDYASQQGISQSDAAATFQNLASQISVQVQAASSTIFLSTFYLGPLQNTAQVTSYQMTRIVANSTPDKQDSAVIKIEASDLPFITLNSSDAIHIQDNVTAIAFPGDADYVASGDFTALLDPTKSDVNTINSLLGPSVNTGQITAQKTASDGTLYYEVNGIAAPGSSGGPVIDAQGNIIGFVDAGPATDRLTYLISSSIAGEYVQQAGIAGATSGAFMTLWKKALTEYSATSTCHWTNAKRDLTTLHAQYPAFGAIQSYLQTATQNATPSDCPAPSSNAGAIIAIVVIVLLAAGAGGYFYYTRRRQQTPAVAGLGMQPYMANPYPSSPYSGSPPQQISPGAPPPPNASQPSSEPLTPGVPPPLGTYRPASGPSASPQSPAEPPPITGQHVSAPPGVRYCPQGHAVSDASAQFCPLCGAALPPASPSSSS